MHSKENFQRKLKVILLALKEKISFRSQKKKKKNIKEN